MILEVLNGQAHGLSVLSRAPLATRPRGNRSERAGGDDQLLAQAPVPTEPEVASAFWTRVNTPGEVSA